MAHNGENFRKLFELIINKKMLKNEEKLINSKNGRSKYFALLLIILLQFATIFAQSADKSSGSISAKVVEKTSKSPLGFANVVLFNAKDNSQVAGTITDEDGFFQLSKIANGAYFLRISFIGFETLATRLFSVTNDTDTIQ